MAKILLVEKASEMHKPMDNHPENHKRIARIVSLLRERGVSYSNVPLVDLDQSLMLAYEIHAKGYMDYLLNVSKNAPVLIDEDTYISEDSVVLALSTLYISYETATHINDVVFLISRPPGHHAGRNGKAMNAPTQGFCLLNNAAAAVYGFRERGFKDIAILDFDAHHGNGTMEFFYKERVLQVDLHQDPNTLYPYTGFPHEIGEGAGYGFKANLTLFPGIGDDVFTTILRDVIALLKEYSPDAVVVSAGFDGFRNDGLADLSLTEISYNKLGYYLAKLGAPVFIVLEGGYGIGLEKGLLSFIKGLNGVEEAHSEYMYSARSMYRENIKVARTVLRKVSEKVLGYDIYGRRERG
ncbi:MAG: histone deacetylase family protein [Desulfurococcaceae archaeon]